MHGSRRKRLLALVLGIAVGAALLATTGCGGKPAVKNADLQILTASNVANRYAFFFSVENDRADIKRGDFTLFPWEDDEFILKTLAIPKVLHRDVTSKKWSENDHVLKVRTYRSYWIARGEVIGLIQTREVRLRLGSKELAVPVRIALVTKMSPFNITEKTANQLKNNLRAGNQHLWRVKSSLGYDSRGGSTLPAPHCSQVRYRVVSAEALFDLAGFLACAKSVLAYMLARKSASPAHILNQFVFTLPVNIEAVDGVPIEFANSVNGITVDG